MNNKTLFKWFSMLLLMMVAGISGVAAQSLTIADFNIKAGETKDVAITLTTDQSTIYGIQTDIVLSEGLTLAGQAAVDQSLSFASNVVLTGATRVSLFSQAGATIASGDVITLSVTAAQDFSRGTIQLTNSRLTTSNAGTELKVADATANVTVDGAVEDVYTIAGTSDLTGSDWQFDEANNMTFDPTTGLYTWTKENITVSETAKPEFKVVKNNDWNTCWPDNNWVITPDVVGGEGVYTITITFNPENNEIGVAGVKTGDVVVPGPEDPEPTVPEGWTNAITNGNLAGDDVSNYVSKEAPSTDVVGARIVDGAGKNGGRGIEVKSAERTKTGGKDNQGNDIYSGEDWDTQFWIVLPEALPTGSKLHVEFDYKADKSALCNTQAHGEPGGYQHWGCIGDVNFTDGWQHFSKDIEIDDAMAKGDNGNGNGTGLKSIAFNLAVEKTATVYNFDNFGVWYQKAEVISDWTDLVVNGDMEGENTECFYVTEQYIGGPFLAKFTPGIGKNGGKAVKVQSVDIIKTGKKKTDGSDEWSGTDWSTQFFIRLPYQIPAGTKYRLSFDYKADKAGGFDTQSHAEPGQYIHFACAGSGNFTTDWQTYEKEGTIPAECDGSQADGFLRIFQTIAFNLAKNKEATEFIFDNVKFEVPSDVVSTLTKNPAANPNPYPADTEVTNVALRGEWNEWSKDALMEAAATAANTWTATIDATNFTTDLKFKLCANVDAEGNGSWVDFYNMTIDAPEGWITGPAGEYADVQLNNSTTGYATYTVTASWSVCPNAGARWTVTIAGKDLRQAGEDAEITKVQLLGSWNWDVAVDNVTLTKSADADKVYTGVLDLSNTPEDQEFKLVINGDANAIWIGNGSNLVIDAPEGWVVGLETGEWNYQLKNATTGYKTYNITATWAGGPDAGAGWTLKVEGKDAREASSLPDGYYVVGTMNNWTPTEGYMLELNEAASTEEYTITIDLEANAEFKIAKVENGVIVGWYPDPGDNYGANDEVDKAGSYAIYFRPKGDGEAGWFNGLFYVEYKGEATLINGLNLGKYANADWYTIQGVRIDRPTTKGLYIRNGRTVIVK